MIINPYMFTYAPAYNPLTTAWIAETGETDTTIINALNTLEQGLIDNSLTSKILALYPFVGGTATKHKYNFMNAVDSDAAFRLTFSGGWTHGSTGATPNAVNAYANTHLVSHGLIPQFKMAFGSYSRVDSSSTNYVYGGNDGSSQMAHIYNTGYFSNIATPSIDNSTATTGFFINRRNANNDFQAYRNGTSLGTETTVQTGNNLNLDFYFGAYNLFGSPIFYCVQEIALGFIGNGFTNQNALDLSTLVATFQTSLSRNV